MRDSRSWETYAGGARDSTLMKVSENLVFGLWPRRLLIFEDRIEVMQGDPVYTASESRPYARVERVRALKGAWFANLLIEGPDGPLLLRGLEAEEAVQAKNLIEERIQRPASGEGA